MSGNSDLSGSSDLPNEALHAHRVSCLLCCHMRAIGTNASLGLHVVSDANRSCSGSFMSSDSCHSD